MKYKAIISFKSIFNDIEGREAYFANIVEAQLWIKYNIEFYEKCGINCIYNIIEV